MTVRLFEPSRKPRDPQKRSKPAEVVPLDRSKFPPATRARFQAFARADVKARRWAGVEQHWTDEGAEYWVVYLPGGETPAFSVQRDGAGFYAVVDSLGATIVSGLDEVRLLRRLGRV